VALWHSDKLAVRCGGSFPGPPSAINSITKHDVEGFRHERLFTMAVGEAAVTSAWMGNGSKKSQ
jgi:hypothetical protein